MLYDCLINQIFVFIKISLQTIELKYFVRRIPLHILSIPIK